MARKGAYPMMKKNVLLVPLVCALANLAAFAKPISKAKFDAATVKIEIYKDRSSYDLDFTPASEPEFKQMVVVTDTREEPAVVQAYLTATGDDRSPGILDTWAETPAGYYAPDKLATKYKYFNDSGSASREPWGIYFLDFADLSDEYVPTPLQQAILAQGDRRNIIALHTFSGPFGARRSHGCARSPEAQIKKLYSRILKFYVHDEDFLDANNDVETNTLLDSSEYPAIAVYGSSAYITKDDARLGTLVVPEMKRSEPMTREEATRIRELINSTL